MKDKILKIQHLLKRIYYNFIYDYNDWKENLWDRDLDENDCCNGESEITTAKLTIRGLPKMTEIELRDLIIWMDNKTLELRDIYSKPLPTKDYSQIYTSRLMK